MRCMFTSVGGVWTGDVMMEGAGGKVKAASCQISTEGRCCSGSHGCLSREFNANQLYEIRNVHISCSQLVVQTPRA